MKFKRYIKEAMLPEKVTRQIALEMYAKSGLKKEIDYLLPILKKTATSMAKWGEIPEGNTTIADQVDIKYNKSPKTINIWQCVKDKEWQMMIRQSGMIFQWSMGRYRGGGGSYSPTGATVTGKAGGKTPFIAWSFPGYVLRAALLGQNFSAHDYDLIVRDLSRATDTLEHEVSHAMRDLQHATISKEIHGKFMKKKVWEKYEKRVAHLEWYFEIDAAVHALRALKARLGQKKWDTMTLKDAMRHHPGGTLNKKEIRGLLQRLAREKLLGKRMKYSGETLDIGELKRR